MEGQPEIIQQALEYAQQGWEIARGWLLSPGGLVAVHAVWWWPIWWPCWLRGGCCRR